MFKNLIKFYSTTTTATTATTINSFNLINKNYFDSETLNRLNKCSHDFINSLVLNLNQYGIKDKNLSITLKTHEDWSQLNRDRIEYIWDTFRELSINNEIYLNSISKDKQILNKDKQFLKNRLKDLKQFFTNKYLERVLLRSPDLLTNNFDLFRYKFTYVFALMGIEQKDMSSTYVFNHPIEHIRKRHLFLLRSAFYDKPNKKGQTKVENPKLGFIVDTNIKEYLRLCTNNCLKIQDYETFCEYLNQENFDNELLGLRIGKTLQNQIIDSIKYEKYLNYQIE